jgi:hypothetical protein
MLVQECQGYVKRESQVITAARERGRSQCGARSHAMQAVQDKQTANGGAGRQRTHNSCPVICHRYHGRSRAMPLRWSRRLRLASGKKGVLTGGLLERLPNQH